MQTRSSPNIQTLHRLAVQTCIPNYERMSKENLFKKLQEKFDIDRLLRTEARHSRFEKLREQKKRKSSDEDNLNLQTTSNSDIHTTKKRVKLNKIDPIMLLKIDSKNCFKFYRPNGTIIRFNIESLVDYLLATGDFSDPETRLSFSEADLKEIDRIAKQAGLNKDSVFEAKLNTNKYSESKFHRDALLALERCAGDVITDMLYIVENYDPDDAQMQLVMREFPTFLDYYRQLRDADAAYASKCNAHWKLYMRGPPNKPNIDECGLINVVCHFLKSCEDGFY